MTTETQTKRTASDLQLKFWRAEERARAARVPESDRDGAGPPVTINGYYEAPTKSGRPAWAYFQWNSTGAHETHCTYNPDCERAANELVIAGADPLWADDGRG